MGGVACAAVLAWLVALCAFDVRHRRLPNWLTLPGAVVITAVAALHGRGAGALLGALALFSVYAAVHLVAPAAMGAGDVKLAIGIGALTGAFGPDVWVLAAMGASLLSTGWAIKALPRHAEYVVPHGVSMCLAAVAGCLLALS
nr:A24 family peptidase [Mycolicibacterium komanii]CRL74568.1 prepilin signal peptidase PulO-like peptidase [Mycolicibacterium komanii]